MSTKVALGGDDALAFTVATPRGRIAVDARPRSVFTVRGVPTVTRPAARPRRLALTAALAVPLIALVALGLDDAHAVEEPIVLSADDAALELSPLGSYRTGVIDAGASEIVVFHAGHRAAVRRQRRRRPRRDPRRR